MSRTFAGTPTAEMAREGSRALHTKFACTGKPRSLDRPYKVAEERCPSLLCRRLRKVFGLTSTSHAIEYTRGRFENISKRSIAPEKFLCNLEKEAARRLCLRSSPHFLLSFSRLNHTK